LAAQHGLTERKLARLHVALEEHLTNIIVHGYQPGQLGHITVRLLPEPGWLRVEIEDDAEAFDPTTAAPPDTSVPLEQRPLGGLGIHMMRKSVDEWGYRRVAGRNMLILQQRLV
jgi:anti-sigma regulatory factor (Ser/Thr protein kinase)